METSIDKESGLGGLFQQIIMDMKNGMPLWEDLIAKATKLHSSLKATILAVTAYLEAFQKIADSATNTRGATREIGTALTRICLRHKAVENRMKHFTGVIMECLIIPLQDRLEEWRKTVLNLDKEHARDYKRARTELKKRSTDTLRLQKKMRKGAGGDVQKRFECGLQDVTERRQLLEETEKHAVRAALIEERGRFCTFVGLLKPVVDEEVAMLTEMGHLQEAVQQLEKHTSDPNTLPPASEQVIADLKSSDSGWSFQTPPSSPSSLGSRKSSMCSISSLNSSSSGSSKSHHSPSHPHWQRSLSQPVGRNAGKRVLSVSSHDSGFMSQDTLFPRPASSFSVAQVSNMSEHSNNSSSSSTPCTPFPASSIPTTTSTWPNLQETMQFERAASAIISERPHTISSAYEKGHSRPPLTVYTFQAPEQSLSQPSSPVTTITPTSESKPITMPPKSPSLSMKSLSKPPLPTRCSSLERPSAPPGGVPAKSTPGIQGVRVLPPGASEQLAAAVLRKAPPSALPAHLAATKTIQPQQPTYVNMHELANMAADKAQQAQVQQNQPLPPPPAEFISPPEKPEGTEKESSTSESSLESSSGYGSQTTFNIDDHNQQIDDVTNSNKNITASKYCTLPRNNEYLDANRRRPLSMTAMNTIGTLRSTLLRRGSMQSNKPPPPIRRTSSITNAAASMGSLENLPPPPAFLLEPSGCPPPNPVPSQVAKDVLPNTGVKVAETVKALTELKHTPASPNSIRRLAGISGSAQNIFQPQQMPAERPNSFQPGGNTISGSNPVFSTFQNQAKSGGVVYAQPSQVIGGSPNAVRRITSFRSQSADRKPEGPGKVGSNFIACLNAKLAPNLSPRTSRRNSEEHGQCPKVLKPQQPQRGPGQSFLDSLNAKLAQQHLGGNVVQPVGLKATKIRQIINSKAQPDPKICHESLMDQIKRGATLKRAKIINDRSAPKIY
ncbi:flocculation protein FLO11 isoform X3 [Dendroctonus ponderosae]|uniref:flocculation protein FLO11 isoform X3 n=1 Tax=Dendroctonus ponderosae TaxID=77166 RepID=UPI002035F104|nr:flocculation protein FLO11 isoform X3 [Dendroctonus ponderosae]